MATTALSPIPARKMTAANPLALAVADANWFSTENLFVELDNPSVSTLLLRCLDYRNAWRQHWPIWSWRRPMRRRGERLWQRDLALPSGWMKTYPRWGMRPIARTIKSWNEYIYMKARLVLVMTYPHYLYLRDLVKPDATVYLNVDDYALYWPSHAKRINELERRAVLEADLTVCVSRLRCEALREAVPAATERIIHLPHGCPAAAIEAKPHATPAEPPLDLSVIAGPRLGYVGSLEDRVDWELLDRLADAIPGATLVLLGQIGVDGPNDWQRARRRCLNRTNVRCLGWKSQAELAAYNRAFDICLIPYLLEHPFNRACNPTKIMDCMGSGRPIVATALPECLLHAERFDVAHSHAEFIECARRILVNGSDDGRAAIRHAHAKENSCARVAERLLDWLT